MRNAINLLPMAYRRQLVLRRRAVQWAAVLCGVVAVGWSWHCVAQREAVELSQRLESLSREHLPTKTMLKQLIDMRRQLDELQQQENVARELEYHRHVLALLGLVGETARASNGRVRVTNVEVTGFQRMHSSPAVKDQGQGGDRVLVRGVSLDNPAIAEMLQGLQNSGMFSRVEVVMTERQEGDVSLRDYELRCEY